MLNLGLMYGVKRSGGATRPDGDQEEREGSLGSRCRALVQGWDSRQKIWLVSRFISYHRERLRLVNIPWFVPEVSGGVGLPETDSVEHQPSYVDCRVGAAVQLGLVRLPCTLAARDGACVTRMYERISKQVRTTFGEGTEDYGGDVLTAKLMVHEYYEGTYDDEDLELKSRVDSLIKFWIGVSKNAYKLKCSALDYNPNWSVPRLYPSLVLLK